MRGFTCLSHSGKGGIIMPRKVGIVSVGYSTFTSIRRETREKSEINYAAIKNALDNAGLSISDIDISVLKLRALNCP